MQAINHALTGAVIGLSIDEPLVAVPLALGSHFVLDAIPHFTPDIPDTVWLPSKAFRLLLFVDALLCFLLVVLLAVVRPKRWLQAVICAFLAAAPDFMWIPKYIRGLKHQESPDTNWLLRFHKKIQWFARPIGAIPEIVWFVGMSLVLLTFLRPA